MFSLTHHPNLLGSACLPSPPEAATQLGRQGRRFGEPQKHSQFVCGRSQRRTNIKAEAASKRRCASPPHPGAAGRPLTRGLSYSLAAQSTAKSTAQSTAPCPPHCGSADAPPLFRAPGGILSKHACEFDNFPLKAWRASVLREGTALGPRGPHVPWTGNTSHFDWQPLPPFSVRALAEILFKAQDALNDFLLQQSRAVELCPA